MILVLVGVRSGEGSLDWRAKKFVPACLSIRFEISKRNALPEPARRQGNGDATSGSPPLPETLTTNSITTVSLEIADDLERAADTGQLKQLELEIDLDGHTSDETLMLRVNGQPLAGGTWILKNVQPMVRYQVKPPRLQQGENIVEAMLKTSLQHPVKWTGLRLKITYKADKLSGIGGKCGSA